MERLYFAEYEESKNRLARKTATSFGVNETSESWMIYRVEGAVQGAVCW